MNLLTSLRYLVALSEHRHFARAAQACHITQPALSNALQVLEKEFGTPIVKRARSYVGLTPEGEQVLGAARRMLHEHALLQQELASSASQPKGRLQLGVVPTAVPVAARFAALLQATHPGIVPVVRALSSQDIEEGLENLSLDMALGFTGRLKKKRLVCRATAIRRALFSSPSPALIVGSSGFVIAIGRGDVLGGRRATAFVSADARDVQPQSGGSGVCPGRRGGNAGDGNQFGADIGTERAGRRCLQRAARRTGWGGTQSGRTGGAAAGGAGNGRAGGVYLS